MAKVMEAFGAWFQALGPALVDRGNPIGRSGTVQSSGITDGGGTNPVTGYTIIAADDFDSAVEMTKHSPSSLPARPSRSGRRSARYSPTTERAVDT